MRKIIFKARESKNPGSAKTTTPLAAALAATCLAGLGLTMAGAAVAQSVAEPKPVKQVMASSLQLAPGAPDRYTVFAGDTLWSLSSKFLKDPYRWNELFKQNKDTVKNPNLIYPGQVLVLDRNGPSLGIETVKLQPREYIETLKKELWTVSPEAIAPFLSKPLVIEPGALDGAARVIGLQDNRVIAGAGDHIYVTNVGQAQRDWQIFRLGEPLKDPETKAVLGHEALYVGDARQLNEGTPADFLVKSTNQEVTTNYYLLPAPKPEIVNYLPRAPQKDIRARVLGLAGGVAYGGRDNVISINRGKADGIELGHVLALDLAGDKVDDRYQGKTTPYQLPERRNGLVFIFRTFEHVAYGLIMAADRPVQAGDSARTP